MVEGKGLRVGNEQSWPQVLGLSLTCQLTVSVSWGCHGKFPQTGWLETTLVYSLPGLEARSTKPRCWQGWFPLEALREDPDHASLPAPGGCRLSLAFFFLWKNHSGFCQCRHMTTSVWETSLCLSLTRTLTIACRVSPDSLG